jgi:hypothetical protein
MSFNGSGTFQVNSAGQPVVTGTVISSTAFNALTADLATGLSTCVTKDGQTNPTANLPMAGYKLTGLGNGSAATDSAALGQVQSNTVSLINSISGTNTITGSLSPALAAYATGQMFWFVAAGDNTGAVTLNINSLGAKSVTKFGSTALSAGEIKSGQTVVVVYDGTRFQTISIPTGDIVFSANTISTSGTNQNMILNPNGTGQVLVNSATDSGYAPNGVAIEAIGESSGLLYPLLTKSVVAVRASYISWNSATSGDNIFASFGTEATFTQRGSISYNRSAGQVAYNTTSDRRAKTITGPVTNSGQIVDQLKVYTGKMNWGTIEFPMMIADEAQQVTPYCVTGQPNAVDDKGNPIYQQIDYSALVPLLLAEVQSLRARVAALEST